MKTCPTCHRTYADEIRFCLEDGTTLERTGEPASPTWTIPAPPAFQSPPPPTLVMPVEPSMSTEATLLNIFISPARAFASFRDVVTFGPAVIRFAIAALIILVAVVYYGAFYPARMGSDNIARASIKASPKMANLPLEQKERAIKMAQNPGFRATTLGLGFALLIGLTLASMPLGALIYWVGSMIFQGSMKYMQALLVWTYAGLPAKVLWLIANVATLLIWPPSNNVAIATGGAGVFHANLGALFTVEFLPVPIHVAALSAVDLIEFYGMALAVLGLRKVARIPWIGSFVIVICVWLLGVVWRVAMAGLAAALMR
jgi:Yip1 domain